MDQTQTWSRLLEIIENERRRWRVPLFIIGAGVSAGKVPIMGGILDYLMNHMRLPGDLGEAAQRLVSDKPYQSRATAASFFGMLQDSPDEDVEKAWNGFTRDFLEGKVSERCGLPATPLWRQEPTPFHKEVAKQVVWGSPPAVCLSLNYDGLTAKAIRDLAHQPEPVSDRLDPLFPCRILTTAREIEDFYGRLGGLDDFHPLIKLRGDIFNAVCEKPGCRFFNTQTPVYEIGLGERGGITLPSVHPAADGTGATPQLPLEADVSKVASESKPDEERSESSYDEVIRCQGCGSPRRVEVDFPGYHAKEEETRMMMAAIYRFVLGSVGCVITCGVSGIWDAELVHFLEACALRHAARIYCLDKMRPPMLQYHTPWATAGRIDSEDCNFVPVAFDFTSFEAPHAT